MARKRGAEEVVLGVCATDAKRATDLETNLGELGTVEPIAGHPGHYLLRVPAGKSGPEGAESKVRDALGPGFNVQRVIEDEKGELQVPTGKITVRFKQAPTDAELRKFATEQGLAVDARNDYVRNQVSFRPNEGAGCSVHEVVKRLRQDFESIQDAWAESLSRFRRG